MTSADVGVLLVEATLSSSAAIVLALLVRRPLRRTFGAAVAYAAWGLVPVAIVAVMLPAMAASPVSVLAAGDVAALAVRSVHQASGLVGDASWWVVAWSGGVAAMALRMGLQQQAFIRSLGALRARPDGAVLAGSVAGLPAVVGLLTPRMVFPADFETRYTPEQQDLLTAHERAHVARGDLWSNALVAGLRCLWWFNPLVHLAAHCFRHDQELACDQRVLSVRPRSRRAYGEAMFNAQLAAQPLPLGCHWGFGHPLTERIAMLKQPLPSPRRWITGTSLVTLMTLSAGVAAWAAQPAVPGEPADRTAPRASPDSPLLNPPQYPRDALAKDVSGKVVLLVDIDAQGTPTAVAVKSAEPAGVFEDEAAAAAWNWKFNPAIEDGKPVASQVLVPVQFEADGEPPAESGSDA